MGFFWFLMGAAMLLAGAYILGGIGGVMLACGGWLIVAAMFDTAMDKLEEIRVRLGSLK